MVLANRNAHLAGCIVLNAFLAVMAPCDERPNSAVRYGRPHKVADLQSEAIAESSGVAASHRHADIYWTHNDSGDAARLFAFDRSGTVRGQCRLPGVTALDWEDMASFTRAGQPWLIVADVGDNGRRRTTCTLHLFPEPDIGETEVVPWSLEFCYSDGAHDCESVGVDGVAGVILLVTKVWGDQCDVFQLPLPTSAPPTKATATLLSRIAVPLATAMDVSSDGRHAIVGTYTDGYLFERAGPDSWEQAFARAPVRVPFPLRRQGEAVCFRHGSLTLLLTSERAPAPLWEIVHGEPPAALPR
ncbi:MAG: hypothetical protein AB7F89_05660 [Pirellulaceae bacterium]